MLRCCCFRTWTTYCDSCVCFVQHWQILQTDGTWVLLYTKKKSWRTSGHQFMTSIPITSASPPLSGSGKSSPDLNPIEMLWFNLKQAVHAQKPQMWINENNSAKERREKRVFHSNVEDSSRDIANAWLQLLLLRATEPLFKNYILQRRK